MKKTITFLSLALLVSLIAFTPKKDDDKYIVDIEKSTIEWTGKKVTGQHVGTIKLKDGSFLYNGNSFKGGAFTIDMTSIAATDGSGKNLIDHLRADDFFGADKFPTSTFVITKVAPAGKDQFTITGNLTIKGISNPVTFPATVKKQGKILVAVAKGVKVDRTKYGIKFRSQSFFQNLGNNMIDDNFELSVNLLAKK